MRSLLLMIIVWPLCLLVVPLAAAEKVVADNSDSPLQLTAKESAWLSSHREISIGIDQHWYPYEFVDEKGIYSGIAADYIAIAGKMLDIRFKVVKTQNWQQAFDWFQQGKIDLLPAVIATDERKQHIQFTQFYFSTPTVLVSRKNAFYATSLNSLEGKTLASVRGFAITEYVQSNYPQIDLKLVESIRDGLSLLDQGKVDAYIGAISGINTEISNRDFTQLIVSAFTPFDLEVSMAVNDSVAPLKAILNKVIANTSNRQRAAIANTWLSVHVEQGIGVKTLLLWGGPPVVLLTLIMLVFFRLNKGLNREIKQRKKVEQQLKHQAQHDPLTGLPNRRLFEELAHFSLAKARREHEKHAILFVDIDGFKTVNDAFGHQLGDELLIAIAKRLKSCIRDSDIIARHGGDEFLILLNNNADIVFSRTVAQKIIQAIRQPYILKERLDQIGASIGIATFPDDGEALDILIRKADQAMYRAKSEGKGRFNFHIQAV